jgi:excisionase family DNA binding protein
MDVFTTGQVAKVCSVATRTVAKWIDTGQLTAFRVPGSPDRRVMREPLIQFLKAHGMPLGELESPAGASVLVVSQDDGLLAGLRRALPLGRALTLATAGSGFEAGTLANDRRPDCVVVDFAIGQAEAAGVCRNLRRHRAYERVPLVALLPLLDGATPIEPACDEHFRRPFDVDLLARRIGRLVAG